MMRINRNSKGFTLIELLIVVAIIGILAAIAIPAYTGYTKKAKVAGVINSMGALKNAIVAYYTEQGGGPPDIADVDMQKMLGVNPAKENADSYTYTTASRLITATVKNTINLGAGQTITLAADNDSFLTWTWGGSADSSYIPKK